MIRIALCLEYPLHQHGGVEVLVRELLSGLCQEVEIYLVSGDESGSLEASPLASCWSRHFHWPARSATADDTRRLFNWLTECKVQLVHFHLGGTYQWNSRSFSRCPITVISQSGIPCVTTNHGAFSIFECVGANRPWWYKLAALPIFWPGKLRQVLSTQWEATVSMHDLKAVQRRFFPVRSRFLQIYHSKLDGTCELKHEKKPVILCLGTVGPRKGQPYLVEAFGQVARRFPDWTLVIAGRHADPKTSGEVDDAIDRHGIQNQCELLKAVSDDRAMELLEECAIFAFPSTHEGLGLALQEAMFSGAACIGSRAGGIVDLIEDEETGLLVPPADPGALAAGLARLMEDAGLRQRLAADGRASIIRKGMTRQAMVARHLHLYSEVIR